MNSPNPKGWLYKTMWNMVQNSNRVTTRQMKLITDFLTVNGREITVSFDQPDLMLKYGSLAETEEFKLIYDMAVLGKSQQEMAAERGITVVNCKKRVERAKKFLRRKLSK